MIEYLFFAFFIFSGLINKKLRLLILVFSIFFIVFQIIFGLTNAQLDSMSIATETILLFIYIILFFYDHSNNNKTGYIYNHSIFWLSVGILIYLGGSFFFNILINHMTLHEYQSYWHYTYIAEIIKNVLFAVAILITSRQTKINPINRSQVPYLDIDMN